MRDKEKLKQWRKAHDKKYADLSGEQKERRRAAVRRYRLKHADKIKLYSLEYESTRRVRDKKRTNETAAKLRLKRKLLVLEKYGQVCSCCGESNYKFLSIDHINGDGNKHRKAIGGGGDKTYLWLIRNDFPSGFQVLCYNCNMAKGIYGECPHHG